MVGMAYILSRNLATLLARSQTPPQTGPEDMVTSRTLHALSTAINFIPDTMERYFDAPGSGLAWAHGYTHDALVIHQLKSDAAFMEACAFYLGAGRWGDVTGMVSRVLSTPADSE